MERVALRVDACAAAERGARVAHHRAATRVAGPGAERREALRVARSAAHDRRIEVEAPRAALHGLPRTGRRAAVRRAHLVGAAGHAACAAVGRGREVGLAAVAGVVVAVLETRPALARRTHVVLTGRRCIGRAARATARVGVAAKAEVSGEDALAATLLLSAGARERSAHDVAAVGPRVDNARVRDARVRAGVGRGVDAGVLEATVRGRVRRAVRGRVAGVLRAGVLRAGVLRAGVLRASGVLRTGVLRAGVLRASGVLRRARVLSGLGPRVRRGAGVGAGDQRGERDEEDGAAHGPPP